MAIERINDGSSESDSSDGEEFKIYSSEEATNIIGRPIRFASYAESFFGKENIDELRLLLVDPVIRDVDYMLLTGEISVGEAFEYFMVLDDIQVLLKRLKKQARKMVQDIESKILYHLENLVVGGKVKTGVLEKLLGGAFNLIYPVSERLGEQYGISHAVFYFDVALTGELMTVIRREISKAHPQRECEIAHKFHSLGTRDDESYRLAFINLHSLDHSVRESAPFQNLFSGEAPDDGVLESLFQEIRILSLFRTVSFTVTTDRGLELKFFHSNTEPTLNPERLWSICLVTVNGEFRGRDVVFLAGLIDRHTGKINVGGADIESVVGREKGRILSYKLLTLLLEHLRSKEEDVFHAPATPPKETQPEMPTAISPKDILGNVVSAEAAVLEPFIPPRPSPAPERVKGEEPAVEAKGYDRYRVSLERLKEAIDDAARNHDGSLRIMRVLNNRMAAKFTESWEKLLHELGFRGTTRWFTMAQVADSPRRDIPLVVPHTLNTHLSEGWKDRQRNVYVIDVSSPQLLLSYLSNERERMAIAQANEKGVYS